MKRFAKLFECNDGYQLLIHKKYDDENPTLICKTTNEKGVQIEVEFGFETIKEFERGFKDFNQEYAEKCVKSLLELK